MATYGATYLTLAELIKRENPDGSMAELTDIISKTTPIATDAVYQQCNNGTYHEDTRIVAKPTGTERAYGMGVAPHAGATEKVTENTCMLADMCIVDADLVKNEGVGKLAQEEGLFLSGMLETHAGRLFDGNRSVYPLQINGINNRADYNVLSSAYVYDNAGGNCADAQTHTSIYIIQWGPKKIVCLTPRNQGGKTVERTPYPITLITDPNDATKKFPAYQTWFSVNFGLFIYDPRCIKRICNISTVAAPNGTTQVPFDENILSDAVSDLEYQGAGAVIYCNRSILKQMVRRASERGNSQFQMEKGTSTAFPTAGPIVTFMGIPIRREDSITNIQDDIV